MRRNFWGLVAFAYLTILIGSCNTRKDPPRAAYLPLAEVESVYGPLITAANYPTPDQHGTGERLGFFRDASGTIWGLPLTIGSSGAILACAPPSLRDAKVTDTIPSSSIIIGATNEPTGWRGGTGKLELLIREAQEVHSRAVLGAQLAASPECWAPELPGPPQHLQYFRLAPK